MSKPKPKILHFHSKVFGVTHKNNNGTSRQWIISRMSRYEHLLIEHEKGNPVDPNAVKVSRQTGEQVGYIGEHLCEDIMDASRDGYVFVVLASALTGGDEGKSRGVNLLIVKAVQGTSQQEIEGYIASIPEYSNLLFASASKAGERPDAIQATHQPSQTKQQRPSPRVEMLILISVVIGVIGLVLIAVLVGALKR